MPSRTGPDALCAAAEHVLTLGLGGRATLVRAWRAPLPPWPPASAAPAPTELLVGLHLDASACSGLVDRGPTPGEEAAAAAFTRLWGPKAETRRFKDGAIVHAVVWEVRAARRRSPW
eukprot:6000262-Prymnesium_polylepis.2